MLESPNDKDCSGRFAKRKKVAVFTSAAFVALQLCAFSVAHAMDRVADYDNRVDRHGGQWPRPHQPNKTLKLSDVGIFYVGGERVDTTNSDCPDVFCKTNNPNVTVQSSQAFFALVEYFIPEKPKKSPIVLIPGQAIMGNTWLMKPPGGESWTSFFVRAGYPVYLFTQPGRGPALSYTDQVNDVIAGEAPANSVPKLRHFTDVALGSFGVGPSYGQFYKGTRFPKSQEFYKQALSNWGIVQGPAGPVDDPRTAAATNTALIKLLEKIGPAIVMGHSSGGREMWQAALQRPELFRQMIGVEAIDCDPANAAAFKAIPILNFWATYPKQRQLEFPQTAKAFGDSNSQFGVACADMSKAIRRIGGRAGMLFLEDIGLVGNTHLLMFDENNIQIAQLVLRWMEGRGNAGLPLH